MWQLVCTDDLLVARHEITWGEAAHDYERQLLAAFAEMHDGRRLLANPHRLTVRPRANVQFGSFHGWESVADDVELAALAAGAVAGKSSNSQPSYARANERPVAQRELGRALR